MDLFLVRRGCPNCGGREGESRLSKGLPCEVCMPVEDENPCEFLRTSNKLEGLKTTCGVEEKLRDFEVFFEKAVGSKPWSLQRFWAKRVLKGESFAIVAPTGVGKSTFGFVASLFTKPKSLLIFPTRLLAEQAGEKIQEMAKRVGLNKRILVYESKKKVREEFLEGNFDILCGTNMFLHKNFDTLSNFKFNFIFIDDTDSFLKSSKNVDNLFKLMGFSEEEIKKALSNERVNNRSKIDTVLVVSSATLKPRGNRVNLFRNLLGFDIQKASVTLRNVEDLIWEVGSFEEALQEASDLIKKLGKGGLVFVSADRGREGVAKASEFLRERGYKVVVYDEDDPQKVYEKLEEGNFHVAVGISTLTNPLVRGIDLPHVIRYAIFLDPPKHVFPVEFSLRPSHLFSLLLAIQRLLEGEEKTKALDHIAYLRRYLTMREEVLDKYPKVKERVESIKTFLEDLFSRPDFKEKILKDEEVSLVEKEGKMFIVVGDAGSYLQASGRTSRFVAGAMTKGLSIVLYWDKKALRSLRRRLASGYLFTEVDFKPLEEVDLESILKEIDRDRQLAKKVLRGEVPREVKDLFKTVLVIVESPNKARTIAGFFGKPQLRIVGDTFAYEVPLGDKLLIITSSLGHVLDLVSDEGFFGVLETKDGFVPVYDTIKRCKDPNIQHTEEEYIAKRCKGEFEDKIQTLKALQNLSYEVDQVFIATDPDAEGEKIAFDLFLHIRPFNENIKRAEFHEVTPRAFRQALEEEKDFDLSRVKAQIVRRVADRWVGYGLSRVLWEVFGKNWLSAGRVQTPVLGWVIERAKQNKENAYEIVFKVGETTFRVRVEDKSLAKSIFEDLKLARVYVEEKKRVQKSPPPPFSTDTILQEASRVLGFSAQKTMNILQDLFESGLITYHRTDSTRVSDAGKFNVAKPYISENFGEDMFVPRTWSSEGAHECIRPTKPLPSTDLRLMIATGTVSLQQPKDAVRLYELIFNRFMASQMKEAVVESALLKVDLPYWEWQEEIVTSILEGGFTKILKTIKVVKLPQSLWADPVDMRKVPKADLFTQGTLIQEMKKRGLGRPSTYAHIVQTLLDRGYVLEVKGRLVPTKRGKEVYTFLRDHYPQYTSEEFTRKLEEAMDLVEQGKEDHQKVLKDLSKIREVLGNKVWET